MTLYKGKRRDDPNSYRGLTLLPVIFKKFEMIMANRFNPVLNSNTFPCNQQSAYQKGLCSLCISFSLQECINYYNDSGQNVHVAFLDSNKAFDTVWHDGLLLKIYELGLRSKTWNFTR